VHLSPSKYGIEIGQAIHAFLFKSYALFLGQLLHFLSKKSKYLG